MNHLARREQILFNANYWAMNSRVLGRHGSFIFMNKQIDGRKVIGVLFEDEKNMIYSFHQYSEEEKKTLKPDPDWVMEKQNLIARYDGLLDLLEDGWKMDEP